MTLHTHLLKSSIFICIFINASWSEIQLIPQTKQIDVNEGGSYFIQFVETDSTTNITQCYYVSEKISGSFDVVKTKNSGKTVASKKYISDLGSAGFCRIVFDDVKDDDPHVWEFTAFDSMAGKNTTANITISFFYNIPLLNNKVYTTASSSFIQYLIKQDETSFTQCTVAFNGTTADLSLTSNYVSTIASTAKNDVSVLKRVSSLGRGYCGYQLTNSSENDPSEWTLVATDDQARKYRNTATVLYFPKQSSNTIKEVYVGESTFLDCGLQKPTDQYYCYLYNPRGKLVYQGQYCSSYSINIVSLEHIGTWKCLVGTLTAMESVEFTVEVKRQDSENVITWVEDQDGYISMGCQLKNPTSPTYATYCEMISPDQRSFNIHAGFATDRYTTLGTNLSQLTCGMEIKKPLKNSENGVWKCKFDYISAVVGGFLNVGIITKSSYSTSSSQTIQLGEKFTVLCTVPYSSDYCHIKAPNGTLHATNDRYKTSLGECSFEITKISRSDNGTWTCSFARDMGQPDEQIYVDVIIAEVLIHIEDVEVTQDETVELTCNSGGIPLQYCRYISPSGEEYHLKPSESGSDSSVINYYGSGLEFGECGIRIKNINFTETGKWTCATRLGYDFRADEISAYTNVHVVNPPLGTGAAASIGIAVGVALILISFGGFRIYKRRFAPKPVTPSESMELADPQFSNSSTFESVSEPSTVRRTRRARLSRARVRHPVGHS